ncbi:MAG: hypothetical protein H6839_01915 [Planctomycetes bacterium]|nr:hypothetical protein [Planctomycetota bacterium]
MQLTDEAAVRERLNEVALRYPQAEIARRTSTPGSSVSRYLKGNRIPVSFVASVGREFGVNPAWLLFGEGAPWLSDVAAEEGKTAAGLAELVQTMGRISKLKLGALAGKEHARNLRDLNDALESFEQVREQLARQSRSTYARVLDDWNKAITTQHRARATRLAKAAEQVGRLCPDPVLNRRHERLRGSYEYLAGNIHRALVHRRRAFFQAVSETGEIDEQALVEAFGVVVTLDAAGLVDDAIRFAEAALKLSPRAGEFGNYGRCIGAYGWVLVQAGRLRKGMGMLATALSLGLGPEARQNSVYGMAYALYLSGTIDLPAAADMLEPTPLNLQRVMFLCPWTRDPRIPEELLRRHDRIPSEEATSPGERIARAHMLSLQGKHARAMEVWKGAEEDDFVRNHNAIGLDFVLSVMKTQLLRAAGATADARLALGEAERQRTAAGDGVTLDPNWCRVHWRNVIALESSGRMRTRANEFAKSCAKRGIHFAPD